MNINIHKLSTLAATLHFNTDKIASQDLDFLLLCNLDDKTEMINFTAFSFLCFQVETNKLKLKFSNITLEPFSTLSADNQIISSTSHVGDGKSDTRGSSGAGHGGHGGVGSGQSLVGISYGSFRTPRTSGRPGAAPVYPYTPGYGGGILELVAQNTAHIDGTVSAKGGSAISPKGSGASGGSILVYGKHLHGQGLFEVSGGDGEKSNSGGGAGGRISIYTTTNNYIGQYQALGGDSNYEQGGAGTVYLERITKNSSDNIEVLAHHNEYNNETEFEIQNRTLYVNAYGRGSREPGRNLSSSFSDFTQKGSARTWVTLDPKDNNIKLNELQIYGKAQVLFIAPQEPKHPLSISITRMQGDRSGAFFIGYNQSFLSLESYLPFNMVIYQGGVTTMQGELLVAGVTVDVDGILQNCENITIADRGVVKMKEMYDFRGQSTKVCKFEESQLSYWDSIS